MILELSDFYLPKEVLHRDKQINLIREVFINFKKNKCGTNLAILGVTGSGKSTVIKKVIEEEDSSIYISGSDTKTPFKTIKGIMNLNVKTHEEMLKRTIVKLGEDPKIIVIDEIDKIKNLKELFNDLNTIYRKTMIPIIIVTMSRAVLINMPTDAKKTLFFEKVTLPAYNVRELKNILKSRLKQIQIKIPKIQDGTLNYLSAIASRQGSARLILYLTLKCIQKMNFNQTFIDEIYKEMMKQEWFGFVDDINESEKEFLKYLLPLCDSNNEVDAETLQKKIGLSQPRVSQLLNTFEKYSVINTYHKNLGRAGGRKRIIKFSSKHIYQELNKMMGYE